MNAPLVMLLALLAAPARPPPPKSTPPPAQASATDQPVDDTDAKARQRFQAALTLYKQARYADAIARFEEVYQLKPSPIIFFNLGRCHEQLGNIPLALKNYREYLRVAPQAKDREEVADAVANLERKLKESGVQVLTVRTEPSGARITVDDTARGLSPISVELKPGNHLVVATLEGHEKLEKSVLLQADKAMEVSVTLAARVEAPVATAPAPTEPAPARQVEPVAAQRAAQPAGSPIPGILVTTAGCIAAGVGGLLFGLASAQRASLSSPDVRSTYFYDDALQTLKAASQQATVGVGLLIGGGVAVLTGIVWAAVAGSPAPAVSIGVIPGTNVWVVGGVL